MYYTALHCTVKMHDLLWNTALQSGTDHTRVCMLCNTNAQCAAVKLYFPEAMLNIEQRVFHISCGTGIRLTA
eukprot:2642-Heterococcus_DN1.PRE.5